MMMLPMSPEYTWVYCTTTVIVSAGILMTLRHKLTGLEIEIVGRDHGYSNMSEDSKHKQPQLLKAHHLIHKEIMC